MQKIVELNLSDLQAVTGGYKTVSATTTSSLVQQPVATFTAPTLVKPTLTTSTSFALASLRL